MLMVLSDCLWIWFGQIIIKKKQCSMYATMPSKAKDKQDGIIFVAWRYPKENSPPAVLFSHLLVSIWPNQIKPPTAASWLEKLAERKRVFSVRCHLCRRDRNASTRLNNLSVFNLSSKESRVIWLKPYSNQSSRTYINKKGKNVYKWHYRTLIKFNNKTEEEKLKELLF